METEEVGAGDGVTAGREAVPLSANALQLSPREWLIAAAGVLALLVAFPAYRARIKSPTLEADYRVPYALTHRHDLYERYSTLAASRFDVFLVGDSVVWGQFADRDGTLAHHLNALAGSDRFANLGLDGMHPIALSLLLEQHAPALVGKEIVLQCDPLWYISTGRKLTRGELLANRPGLAPPPGPGPSSFEERLPKLLATMLADAPRLRILSRQLDPLFSERLDILAWTLDHPYENPFKSISFNLPPPEQRPPPMRSTASRARASQDARWDPLVDSPQWLAFQNVVQLLRGHGNRLFILVGPMNEDLLTPRSRAAYQGVKQEIAAWCRGQNLAHAVPGPLPFEFFADICHPTGPGYSELARRLRRDHPVPFGPAGTSP
jgi:hypothetical protein